MHVHKGLWIALVSAGVGAALVSAAEKNWDGALVTYGSMHEVMGEHRSEGRVQLADLTGKPHLYAVAAPEGLMGEITVFDSDPTVTGVTTNNKLEVLDAEGHQATLLVGAYVSSWSDHGLKQETTSADFDKTVRDEASKAGLDVSTPFVFIAEGEFKDVRVHVLRGAFPMHAKMQGVDLPAEQEPYESEFANINGKLVGVYAENAVGQLTHPGTSTHVHLIYKDPSSGQTVTAHVEQIGMSEGAVLRLPQ